MSAIDELGTMLESLSFEARGDASKPSQPTVLSCGGLYFPKRDIPLKMRTWKQIVCLPGNEMSAKIFGVQPPEKEETLTWVLQKEILN